MCSVMVHASQAFFHIYQSQRHTCACIGFPALCSVVEPAARPSMFAACMRHALAAHRHPFAMLVIAGPKPFRSLRTATVSISHTVTASVTSHIQQSAPHRQQLHQQIHGRQLLGCHSSPMIRVRNAHAGICHASPWDSTWDELMDELSAKVCHGMVPGMRQPHTSPALSWLAFTAPIYGAPVCRDMQRRQAATIGVPASEHCWHLPAVTTCCRPSSSTASRHWSRPTSSTWTARSSALACCAVLHGF